MSEWNCKNYHICILYIWEEKEITKESEHDK